MHYPTLDQVNHAEPNELAFWYRFLPSPAGPDQVKIMNAIIDRFRQAGGFTPQLSKAIGWEPPR